MCRITYAYNIFDAKRISECRTQERDPCCIIFFLFQLSFWLCTRRFYQEEIFCINVAKDFKSPTYFARIRNLPLIHILSKIFFCQPYVDIRLLCSRLNEISSTYNTIYFKLTLKSNTKIMFCYCDCFVIILILLHCPVMTNS